MDAGGRVSKFKKKYEGLASKLDWYEMRKAALWGGLFSCLRCVRNYPKT